MLARPQIGQPVQIWYARHYCHIMPLHAQLGIVTKTARGPGPRTHTITIHNHPYQIPSGNLRKPRPDTS